MPYAQRDTHSDIRTSHTGRYTHRGTHGATRAHAAQGDIPHVDEMLHHLTPQPDRILHGSLPSFTPDLVSGSRLGVFGPNPRRSTECCTTLLLFMMSSVPHQNENGGQGGRKTRAIYKGRRKEMPQTGGAIFCRCAVRARLGRSLGRHGAFFGRRGRPSEALWGCLGAIFGASWAAANAVEDGNPYMLMM